MLAPFLVENTHFLLNSLMEIISAYDNINASDGFNTAVITVLSHITFSSYLHLPLLHMYGHIIEEIMIHFQQGLCVVASFVKRLSPERPCRKSFC